MWINSLLLAYLKYRLLAVYVCSRFFFSILDKIFCSLQKSKVSGWEIRFNQTFGESLLTVSCLWCILWILIINFNFLPIKLQVVLARAREPSVTESAWNMDTLTCPLEICCETKVQFFYEFDSLTWLRLWVLSHAWKLITAIGVQLAVQFISPGAKKSSSRISHIKKVH